MKWHKKIAMGIIIITLIIIVIEAIIVGRPFTSFLAFIATMLAIMVAFSE